MVKIHCNINNGREGNDDGIVYICIIFHKHFDVINDISVITVDKCIRIYQQYYYYFTFFNPI